MLPFSGPSSSRPQESSPETCPPFRPLQTVSDLNDKFQLYQATYISSTRYETVKNLIENTKQLNVTEAISLGLGSLFRHRTRAQGDNDQSMIQFAEIWTIVQLLENRKRSKIPTYVQDPSFCTEDKIFFESIGVKVLPSIGHDDNPARNLVTENSFLHMPRLEVEVALRTLDGKDPELYLGTDLRNRRREFASGQRRIASGVIKTLTDAEAEHWVEVIDVFTASRDPFRLTKRMSSTAFGMDDLLVFARTNAGVPDLGVGAAPAVELTGEPANPKLRVVEDKINALFRRGQRG